MIFDYHFVVKSVSEPVELLRNLRCRDNAYYNYYYYYYYYRY